MDIVAAQTPNNQIAALVGGSLDVVFVAPDVAVRAVAGGAKIKIIGARQDAPAWSLVSSKNITKAEQLKGKVVGASELKGSTTVMLRKLLEKLGLKASDYDLVVVGGSSARYAAITSGAVSAGLLNQPFDLKAVAEGYNRLGVTSEAVPKWLSDSIVTSDSFISKNPEALVRYLRAYQEGVDWLLDPGKKNEVLAVLQPALKASATEAAEMYRMYYETPGVIPKQAKVNMDNLQAVIDVMVAEGDLEKDKIPAIKDLVDTRFLEQAIERK
ncbi:MAG: ABC transporter substrate-binding protein [Chloroflexi bacterium]|nr:ABC transporter substrate-binding protein [Chloroflexota bacterium]